MSTFTNILIDIEEMYGNGMGSSEIAAAINQRYSTVYTSAEVDNAIQELLEDYDDSMDGDHDSALASAGWGTDEDYGYYGE